MALTSAQLLVLKHELVNDPLSLGYASHLSVGDSSGAAVIVNTVGPANDGRFSVPNEPVSASKILAQITPDDLQAMTSTNTGNLSLLLTAQTLDLSSNGGNNLANVLSCLPNPGNSRTAMQGLSIRPGRRSEVIFSVNGLTVTANDVSNAMALVG